MKNLFAFLLLLFFAGTNLTAQCPPSQTAGVHVVQQDENLFRIARMYNMSLSRLLSINNLSETSVINVCRKLKIDAGKLQPAKQIATARSQQGAPVTSRTANTTPTAAPVNNSTSGNFLKLQRQAGNRHVVQPGETAAGLARLYGYTEERFREFNAMGGERLTAGSIVLSHDCACDRVMFSENATPANTTNTNDAVAYRPETTTYYEEAKPARIKTHKPITPDDLGRPSGESKVNTEAPSPRPNNTNTSAPAADAPYMQSLEMDMLKEINMMRANPPAYIQYINEYVAYQKANNGFPVDQAVVDELNAELRKLGPLSQLQPKECVYIAAKKHGQDILKMGRTDHVGSDGKWPWDRVRRECPDLQDGNENLVGGPDNVRESVVILLIDEGIPNRGHRKTLLRSDWVYGACYNIGKVGMMPHCWVQKFGF